MIARVACAADAGLPVADDALGCRSYVVQLAPAFAPLYPFGDALNPSTGEPPSPQSDWSQIPRSSAVIRGVDLGPNSMLCERGHSWR